MCAEPEMDAEVRRCRRVREQMAKRLRTPGAYYGYLLKVERRERECQARAASRHIHAPKRRQALLVPAQPHGSATAPKAAVTR